MASDLPDMRPDTSLAMARMLVQTMGCDQAVFMRLKEEFDHPPCLRTIRQLRIEAATSRLPLPDMDPPKPCDGWRPMEISEAMDWRNKAFIGALRASYPERFAA